MAWAVADPDLSQGATGPVTEVREAALGLGGLGGEGLLHLRETLGERQPPHPSFFCKSNASQGVPKGWEMVMGFVL